MISGEEVPPPTEETKGSRSLGRGSNRAYSRPPNSGRSAARPFSLSQGPLFPCELSSRETKWVKPFSLQSQFDLDNNRCPPRKRLLPQSGLVSCRRTQHMNFENRVFHTVPDSRDVHSEPATDIPTGICFTDHTSVPLANFFPLPEAGVIDNLSPLSEETGFPFGRSPAHKPQVLHQRSASPSIRAGPPLLQQGALPSRNPERSAKAPVL